MEFKSKVCTTKEQSERLLKLGLKKETADMCFRAIHEGIEIKGYQIGTLYNEEHFEIFEDDIPAWSLHRLMEIMYEGDLYGFVSLAVHDRNIDTIYNLVIANIDGLININKFNPEYLEEK